MYQSTVTARALCTAALGALAVLGNNHAHAQSTYVKVTSATFDADVKACQAFATSQTGHRMAVTAPQERTGGEVAAGSFVGLLFAPLAATPAAPIVVGGLLGGAVRIGKENRNAARRQGAATAAAARNAEYQRAFNACMASRGHRVQ